MKPQFQTKHFDVYRFKTQPTTSLSIPRLMYVATFREIEWPGQVVTACVCPDVLGSLGGAYVDWIETSENHRRNGYAMEVCEGIEKDLGMPLMIDGTTVGGAGLENAWARREEAGEHREN